jgi:Arc/MetJ family transcription regulator
MRATINQNMRTTVDVDEQLITAAMQLTGARTKSEVVHLALQELVKSRKKKQLLDLAGKFRFSSGFDHKTMRKLRM